ncbi:MAG: HAD-IA family hydrolase [Lachnospiraceae bacterium]|nr:HAD-IA family hydrolase [Lachnospiraceae bacterium]
MIKAVIFDMFETLVSLFQGRTYFSENIAEDLGIPLDEFRTAWHATETDRSTGLLTMEEGIGKTLELLGRYSEESVQLIAGRRREALGDTFSNIPQATFDLLTELHARGIRIGLISNCFSDECEMIKASPVYPYFDAAKLSFEQGICKPDLAIYFRITAELGVEPEECLYVGDGGSRELYAAREAGMQALQAEWFRPGFFEPHVPCAVLPEFEQLAVPADVLKYL